MSIEVNTPIIAEGLPVNFRDQTVWRNPECFDQSYMFEYDFDETCYTTFISSGDGIEVHEAYEIAVEAVLGPNARQDFSDYGGLSNRAPLDVIESLIEKEPDLIRNALEHARKYFAHPDDITDIGLGIIARFADRNYSTLDELTTRAITEMLVVRKKERLIPQISPTWPQPVPGFVESWQKLHELKNNYRERVNMIDPHAAKTLSKRDEKWKHVHFAIVSSGHTDFIQKVIDQARLPHADVYMTDDEMRRQVQPRTKPHPFALELVRNAWMNAYLVPKHLRNSSEFLENTKSRQAYVGDDNEKDGKMAINDGIEFIFHDGMPSTWSKIVERTIEIVENGDKVGTAT